MTGKWHEDAHVSTCALSVWNALSMTGLDMSDADTLAFLRERWCAELPDDFTTRGAEYLISRGWVRRDGDVLVIVDRDFARKAKKLERSLDGSGLVMTSAWAR